MRCPDLSALARAAGPQADPAVAEHVRTCDSCRLDWQIQQGTRYLLDPQIDTNASAGLDERIIARATAIMRHSEQLPGWGHLIGAGLAVALAAVAIVWWVPVIPGAQASVTEVGLYALVVAVATVLYLRRIDRAECSGGRHEYEDDRPMST